MAKTDLVEVVRRLTRGMAAAALADHSDLQLVALALATPGESAFHAIVQRHGPMVYRVCWRILQHTQDTEDAFQATFLVLAQRLRTLRKHASLASWLHGVAHRVALKAKAGCAARRARENQAAVPDACPPDDATWAELREVLDEELSRLPEKLRLPLILCYLEGRTQDEAARELRWSKITLRRRLDEARDLLRHRLKSRDLVWSAALSAALFSDCIASAAPAPGLIASTVGAISEVVAGKTVTAVASAQVTSLTEGVLKTMYLSKLKTATLMFVCGLLVMGAGLAHRVAGSGAKAPNEAGQGAAKQKVDDGAKPAPKTDQEALQGTWIAESFEVAAPIKAPPVASLVRFTFKGDKVTFHLGTNKYEGSFQVNLSENPKHLDYTLKYGEKASFTAIYELKGEVLVICLDNEEKGRPTTFKAEEGRTVVTLRREGSKGAPKHDPVIENLFDLALKASLEEEKLRAENFFLLQRVNRAEGALEDATKYIAGSLKSIDTAKNCISVQIVRTTFELKDIPIAADAKYHLDGKECGIDDLKAKMSVQVLVESRAGRSHVVEIKAKAAVEKD